MADGVMRGIGRMSDQASEALGPLGAKLDAKLGTVGKAREGNYPQDPLLPAEAPVPQNRRGLFETLGGAVPQIAGFVAGNEVPVAGPVAPRGSVAAFPSPKQSMKAMQEEAVMRDLMEAKGARPIELPPEPSPMAFQRQQRAAREAGVTTERLRPGAPRYGATPTAEGRAFDAQSSADRVGQISGENFMKQQEEAAARGAELPPFQNDWRDVSQDSYRAAARPEMYRGQIHEAAFDEVPHASMPPTIPAEQTELERYLAGLYGPKAK